MPEVLPNIPQEPAQGIQALLDTVYLWNPDVANGLIDKVNELLKELEDLTASGKIKPYSELTAPVHQYLPMYYEDGVYVAAQEISTLPSQPDMSKWILIATKGGAFVAGDGIDISEDVISVEQDIIQGASAGSTAVQPGDLAAVATSGDYDDLSNKPTLGTAASADITDFATAVQGAKADTAVQPGDLATVATTGDYEDLSNLPQINGVTLIGNKTSADLGITTPKYLSVERLGAYVYKATFDAIPEYDPTIAASVIGNCTSFVRDGKLYRNFDWKYDNRASFVITCKDFQGMAYINGLNDGDLDVKKIEQLPYHLVDGINSDGIMVSTHVLYNDWTYAGAGDKDQDIMLLPYYILNNLHSISDVNTVLANYVANIKIPDVLANAEYLLQFVVTDGTTTYCVMPPASATGSYVIQDITSNPKLTNFRWVSDATVVRTDLQTRPTGVERWNSIGADTTLEDLRFTDCYVTASRLSEFIGIDETTKDSTDEELEEIFDRAHAIYINGYRGDGLWQTVHSVVFGSNGIEHLWCQENYGKDYIGEPETVVKNVITLTGESGRLTPEQIAQVLDDAVALEIVCDGQVFRLSNKDSTLTYRTYLNEDCALNENVVFKAIYIQLNSEAVNYGAWSLEEVSAGGGGNAGIEWKTKIDLPEEYYGDSYSAKPYYTISGGLPDGTYEFYFSTKVTTEYSGPLGEVVFKVLMSIDNTNTAFDGKMGYVFDGNYMNDGNTVYGGDTKEMYDLVFKHNNDTILFCSEYPWASDVFGYTTPRLVPECFKLSAIKNVDTGDEYVATGAINLDGSWPEYTSQYGGSVKLARLVNPPTIPQAATWTTLEAAEFATKTVYISKRIMGGSLHLITDGSELIINIGGVGGDEISPYSQEIVRATGIFADCYLAHDLHYAYVMGVDTTTAATLSGTVRCACGGSSNDSISIWFDTIPTGSTTPLAQFGPQAYRLGTITHDSLGNIVQYTGETSANYTNGYFYKAAGTPVTIPASLVFTNVSPSDFTITVADPDALITAMNNYGGWGEQWVKDRLAYEYTQFSIAYDADTGTVARVWWSNFGDFYYQDILECFTVNTTGSYSGEVSISFDCNSGYTPESKDVQNPQWEQVDVQPSSGGLPDQTGNAGKFLTTDGTDASWENVPVEVDTSRGSVKIASVVALPNTNANIVIGTSARATSGSGNIAIGRYAEARNGSIHLGNSTTEGTGSIGISGGVGSNAHYAIQLGGGSGATLAKNSDANTFKVANANGNFEIMSADGTIPADRLTHAINKYSTMPTAASTNEGWIVQFTGTTDATYTHGYIYECKAQGTDPETYAWEAMTVQAGGGGSYTAGTGIDITNDVISVTAPTLQNKATFPDSSIQINPTATSGMTGSGAIAIGINSKIGIGGVAIGNNISTNAGYLSTTVGNNISNTPSYGSVNLGNSVTSTTGAMSVALSSQNPDYTVSTDTYILLNRDGTVPTARLTKVNTTATLAVADWSSSTQTVTVSGVKADSVVFVSPAPASASDYASAGILCTAQAENSLTFTCTTTPSNAITVNVVCM